MTGEPVLDYDALPPGKTFPAVPCPLSDSFVDAYLSATREDHPLFGRPGRGEGYAPPFCTSLVGFVKGSLGGRWPNGTVHVSQDMRALRPLRRGELLELDVEIGDKSIRDGRRFIELKATTRDRDRRPVVTSAMVLLWAGATQTGPAGARRPGAARSAPATASGVPLEPVSTDFPAARLEAYGRLAGAQDPIHLDPEYARGTRFGRNIAQGMLVATLLSRLMTQARGVGWLATAALAIRFTRPVFVGERVTARGVAEGNGHELSVWCEKDDGERVIAGRASVRP